MRPLGDDIRRLFHSWEAWAIVGFITLLVMAMGSLAGRQPAIDRNERNIEGVMDNVQDVKANVNRIEKHLEAIDKRMQGRAK